MTPDHPMPAVDKSTWGDGPWQSEPDRVEFEHAGLPCLLVRGPHGSWCGYAAVPPDHPLYRMPYNSVDADVHGGLTYANTCQGHICHEPKPGEPDNVWWFGFDTGHAGDYSPGMDALLRKLGSRLDQEPYDHTKALTAPSHLWGSEVYRTVEYVRRETINLATQLADPVHLCAGMSAD